MQKGIKTIQDLDPEIYRIYMTRPQKCKRGLRPLLRTLQLGPLQINDPTAEMQKGIKTHGVDQINRALRDDPTAEMQKGIKTRQFEPLFRVQLTRYDPTAEMQKGIKTRYELSQLSSS